MQKLDAIDAHYKLTPRANGEIAQWWLTVCLASNYQKIFGAVCVCVCLPWGCHVYICLHARVNPYNYHQQFSGKFNCYFNLWLIDAPFLSYFFSNLRLLLVPSTGGQVCPVEWSHEVRASYLQVWQCHVYNGTLVVRTNLPC